MGAIWIPDGLYWALPRAALLLGSIAVLASAATWLLLPPGIGLALYGGITLSRRNTWR